MKIFLSAVSSEFEACRDALASDLRAVGAEATFQRDFTQHPRTLLEKLETYVADCDRVIALVANAYGAEPDAAVLPPGTPRRSYTQWEYAFAQGERLDGRRVPPKDTFVYVAAPEFPRSAPLEQSADRDALQQAFVASIRAHGKDRSTFASDFELRLLVLRDGFRLGPITAQPNLTLELFNLSESTRFFYGAQRIPIIGREEELASLGEFLHGDGRFSWWLMTGPAGVGKSRVALESCLRALRHQPAWHAGWLTGIDAFTEWSTWQPKAPTLIVIDDASRVVDAAREMLVALFRRRDTLAQPVRVLLLERDATGNWQERLTGSGAQRHSLDAARYGGALRLGGLQSGDLWTIVSAIAEQETEGTRLDRDGTIAALEKIDALKRPLFASFAADAVLAGRDIGQWDRKELLESVLKTDIQERWEPAGVTEEDKNLIAVATIAGGVPLTVLKKPPIEGWLPAPRAYSPERYRVMSGRASDETLSPLTPDVLGEFFVLEQLRPSSSIDERPAALLDIALALPSTWRTTSLKYGWTRGEESARVARLRTHLHFVGRCARDFPDHPSLQQLRGPLPQPDENSWGWSIDLANLIDELLPLPGTLDFCHRLHDALYEVAFEHAVDRTNLPPSRVAATGVSLVVASLQAGDLEAAEHRHRLLQNVAAADPSLARYAIGTGATLAKVQARSGRLTEAHVVFGDAAKAWQAATADERGASAAVLIMTAKTMVEASVGADRIDLAAMRYRDMRLALEGYVDEDGSLAAYETDAIRALMRACIEKGQLAEARALYDDMRRLALRDSPGDVPGESPAGTAAAPPDPDPKPTITIERSESGTFTVGAEWRPSSQSNMGQTLSGLLLKIFGPLSGQTSDPPSPKKTPAPEPGPQLREHMAARAVELMKAYSEAADVPHATDIHADLRTLYDAHSDERAVVYMFGHGTHVLWRAQLTADDLLSAANTCELERFLANAHGADDEVFMKSFAIDAHRTVVAWDLTGDAGVVTLAQAWHETLLRPDARAAITGDLGLEEADRFYVLLAQHASGAPPVDSLL